jgi:hypothetical protein
VSRLADPLGPFLIPIIYFRDSQIQAQISVLNKDYGGTGLSFKLMNTTRTLNADWFNSVAPETPEQTDMKQSLRTGDSKTLNLYTVGFATGDGQGLLGYATFPSDYASNPKDDGVVILYSSFPGGTMTPYNLGRTSTHEIGHWLGLYHPFQGGCTGDGDFVDDTPAEASPASGCPAGRDTCPSSGVDRKSTFVSSLWNPVAYLLSFPAIHNYMDYSDDSCMNNFTPGQLVRIKSQISMYRGINL